MEMLTTAGDTIFATCVKAPSKAAAGLSKGTFTGGSFVN
jgi:hypothetical protein